MKKHLSLIILLCTLFHLLQAQTMENRQNRSIPDSLAFLFNTQLTIFPQEKIYVHTDKSHYLSGETIWFRAYLADAITHAPASVSRYVYVELINPLDSVVTRVKIRPDEEAYYGHLLIPQEAPRGYYTLRAYTAFMTNQEENYFYTKTLQIGNPKMSTADAPDGDFDVSFYPEGGSLLLGAPSKVAFKALKSNGRAAEVTGTVYNQSGNKVETFRSNHLGMGLFMLRPQKGERYHAICEDNYGQSIRFDLPSSLEHGYALAVAQVGEYIHVSVQKSTETAPGNLYLLAHSIGIMKKIGLLF